VFKKAEKLVIESESFDIKTVNSLIFLINNEIRDDMKPDFIFNVIMILYKSPLSIQKLTKKTETYRINFDRFMEYGLNHYINVIERENTLYSRFTEMIHGWLKSYSSSPLLNLREFVDTLKQEKPICSFEKIKGGENNINLVLPSPMEEAEVKISQDILELPILPSLLEDSDTADSTTVGSFSDQSTILEK
jgi:hypothetical protein